MDGKKEVGVAGIILFSALLSISPAGCAPVTPCDHWYTIHSGDLILVNKQWGKYFFHYTDRSDNRQCVFKREVNGETVFGWNWEWPFYEGHVKAYPEVIFGRQPYLQFSTTPLLPKKVADIKELTADYDLSVKGTGKYNLAFDIWITKTAAPTPDTITREIMIWIGNLNWDTMDVDADGLDIHGRVSVGGQDYRFTTGDANTGGWTYLAFVKINKEQRGGLDLMPFIRFLLKERLSYRGRICEQRRIGQ
ncbi:MAG TPA: hypothetical protein ENN69_03755 [Spirochaetia bacterium]|nr:hypothetical protein [Spirochaetia bacterium]